MERKKGPEERRELFSFVLPSLTKISQIYILSKRINIYALFELTCDEKQNQNRQ